MAASAHTRVPKINCLSFSGGESASTGIDFDEDFLPELVPRHFRRHQWQAKPLFSNAYGIHMPENPSAHRRKFNTVAHQASSAGVSGLHAGRKYGFDETTTDTNRLFSDAETTAVVVTTQHDSHARFVLQALAAGMVVK